MTAEMGWRYDSDEQWSIHVETRSGKIIDLKQGGAGLEIDGVQQNLGLQDKECIRVMTSRDSNIDCEPLRIVGDCFLVGKRKMVEDFV